jgi:hypothetical protein
MATADLPVKSKYSPIAVAVDVEIPSAAGR